MLNTYFHDAQWVRKHWDLDVDYDTDSEEDTTFGKDMSSDSSEKKDGPEQEIHLLPSKQLSILEEDGQGEQGAEHGSGGCVVFSKEEEVEADGEETHLVVVRGEDSSGIREPFFSDR